MIRSGIRSLTARLKHSINNVSLQRKLILSYIMIIIIPLAITNAFLLKNLNQFILDRKSTSVRNTISQISYNIDYKLNLYQQVSNLFFFNTDINSLIYEQYESSFEAYNAYSTLSKFFNIVLSTNSDLLGMAIYSNNPTLIPDYVMIYPINDEIRAQDWYEETLRKRWHGYFSNVYTTKPRNESGQEKKHFYYARTLNFFNYKAEPSILVMDINENYLFKMMEKESADHKLYIVNDSGYIISGNDRKHISERFDSLVSPELMEQQAGPAFATIGSVKYLVVSSGNSKGWKVVALVPVNTLLELPADLVVLYIIIYFTCFLVSFLLILTFSRTMSKRLLLFEKSIRNMETNSFNISNTISGEDEIGRISAAFQSLIVRLKNYLREITENEIKIRNAEIKALQSQINPHFLYNTMDTIYWLVVRSKNEAAAKMLVELSSFYRSVLSKGDTLINVGEEINILKNYISIEKEKLDSEIGVHYFIDQACDKQKILKFLLQPFVENILNHAVNITTMRINIIIRLFKEEGSIHIEIIDDGVGINKKRLAEIMESNVSSSGYAIFNIKERLKLYYRDGFNFNIHSAPGIGTKVEIVIPASE